MEQTQPNETLIRRIQKLMALAGNNPNEAEAAAAMALAQKLVGEHNLELHQVQSARVAGGTNTEEEKRKNTKVVKRSAMYAWQRELYRAIAEANFCVHWVQEVTGPSHLDPKVTVTARRHMLIGSVANVTVVQYMADYLFETIERVLPYPNKERMSRSAASWRAGCAARLAERVTAQAEAARKVAQVDPVTNCTGITLRDVAQREQELNYDARYGKGAWTRRQASNAAWEAGAAQRQKEYEERQAKLAAEYQAMLDAETPAQRAKRLKAEEKQAERDARASERYWNRAYRESSKRDHSAYRAGSAKGAEIGINPHVGAGKPTGRIG